MDGNEYLVESLQTMGITTFFGVNGGGIIHLAKLFESFFKPGQALEKPRMFTLSEYIAGFCPVGYFLASQKIACVITTTGAASQLALPGLSDSKFMNIPALYLVALNSTESLNKSPLQDVSSQGMNITKQIEAEIGTDCYVISNKDDIKNCISGVHNTLAQSRPAVLCFHPDILCQKVDFEPFSPPNAQKKDSATLNKVVNFIKEHISKRRFILYVSLEASLCSDIQPIIDRLSNLLGSPFVWSVNGANAVNPENPYRQGFIMLGGNDASLELWQSLNENDVLICLGFDSGEYSLAIENIPVGECFIFTNYEKPYASINGGFQHRIRGNTITIHGHINETLSYLINLLDGLPEKGTPNFPRFPEMEMVTSKTQTSDCIDLYDFYKRLIQLWRPESLGFDDV